MRRVAFYTLGCKVNQQETQSMRVLFEAGGYRTVPFEDVADVYVINTCTVTQVSDKKSRQQVARAHARNPEAVIAVVGCYAQHAPEAVRALPGVRLIVGTRHRDKIVELVEGLENGVQTVVEDIALAGAFEQLPTATYGKRTRIQLKIQDGCDRYCTYCIIPYARGPVRSLPPEAVRAQLDEIGRAGAGEVVLTGIHLMSYGKDLPGQPSLTDIILYAAGVSGIGRVRLGSLEPALVDDAFVQALSAAAPNKLCRQFHLSLQSGSDTVLMRMRRRYTADLYRRAAARLRGAFPGCAVTTDVIAGFPGETEEEHRQTLAFIKEMRLARLHVFPYSRRVGTKAADMDGQLPKAVKERRARELIALGKALEEEFLHEQIGGEETVLLEECADGYCEGYTGNYARARVSGGQAGELRRVRIIGVADGVLETELS